MRDYDAWRLNPPHEDLIGMEGGEACNRFPEPDGDEPRGYKPKRCKGEMIEEGGEATCDRCGLTA